MQLTQIKQLTGTLVLKTGLHIGAGDTEMRIGGTDNPVAKNPLDDHAWTIWMAAHQRAQPGTFRPFGWVYLQTKRI